MKNQAASECFDNYGIDCYTKVNSGPVNDFIAVIRFVIVEVEALVWTCIYKALAS